MSFNLRYDNPADGYHGWAYRRDWAGSIVRLYAPDVLGVQEALAGQVADLAVRAPDMGWVGVGRDDGVAAGEFAAIFYRAARLSLLAKGTFWLSKTPEVPGSRNWKACCVRIVTWAKFSIRSWGGRFSCSTRTSIRPVKKPGGRARSCCFRASPIFPTPFR